MRFSFRLKREVILAIETDSYEHAVECADNYIKGLYGSIVNLASGLDKHGELYSATTEVERPKPWFWLNDYHTP
jgi:hypothetical protein